MTSDLAFLGIAESAELIGAEKLSPVEYTKALLDQIERHDSKFNAFIALTPERALTAARAAEAEISARSFSASAAHGCQLPSPLGHAPPVPTAHG